MRARRPYAFVVLASYLAGAVALPILHRRHHERYGDDHVHTAYGTIYFGARADEDAAFHHAAFDADLAALELSDVAHAGAASVDCSLAAYTLAACDEPASEHPHTFGDELLAHAHPSPRPFDPNHGRGAVEHLSASLLAPAPFVLPPPAVPVDEFIFSTAPRSHATAPRLTHSSRGPPARA